MYTVIAPVAGTREGGDWHQFDGSHAQLFFEIIQVGNDRAEGALRRIGADMEFVEDDVLEWQPVPVVIGPAKCGGVNDRRRAVNTVRLVAGNRIGSRTATVEEIRVRSAYAEV